MVYIYVCVCVCTNINVQVYTPMCLFMGLYCTYCSRTRCLHFIMEKHKLFQCQYTHMYFTLKMTASISWEYSWENNTKCYNHQISIAPRDRNLVLVTENPNFCEWAGDPSLSVFQGHRLSPPWDFAIPGDSLICRCQ